MKILIKSLERGKIKGKYLARLKVFALTLHFYSPKAYSYIRSTFKIDCQDFERDCQDLNEKIYLLQKKLWCIY